MLTKKQRIASFWAFLSTAAGLGFIRIAPGTWGSLPGLALGAWVHGVATRSTHTPGQQAALTTLILLVAVMGTYYCIMKTENLWQAHDDQRVVLDEVMGQMLTVAYFTPSWLSLGLGFVLFRFFDIVKPGPIGWIDRNLAGAFGTLADDLLAGLLAALVLAILARYGIL